MVVRVKENCQQPNKILQSKEKSNLKHVTWESPRENCAKKAHDKIKKNHHIAVPSRA
jgi:hypothetical protein